jgi:uncharacterized protein (DUF58 family)
MNAVATWRRQAHERFVRWALRVRPPEAAPIVMSQRRVYVLPTRAGLAFCTALVVILLGAMNYNLSLGYGLVFLLAGMGVVNILHTFRNLAQLQIRPGRAEPVFAGEPAAFELLLDNRREEVRPALLLSLFMDDALTEVDAAPCADTRVVLRVPTTQRGRLALPRVTLATFWPLGLIRAWGYLAPDMHCVVYPAPAPNAPPLPWSGDAGQGSTRDGSGRDDFAGLRDHQPADPPRHVAWKAVARQPDGPLLTKLFSGATAQRIMLHWDGLSPTLGLEQRLAILTRWMLDAEAAGLSWGVNLPAFRLDAGSGSEHLHAGLRGLALYGDAD